MKLLKSGFLKLCLLPFYFHKAGRPCAVLEDSTEKSYKVLVLISKIELKVIVGFTRSKE